MLQYIKAFESDEFHPCNGGGEGGAGEMGHMRREQGGLRGGGSLGSWRGMKAVEG